MKEQQRTPENRGIRMEQYKVILVDDEVEVIDIMKQKIRWNALPPENGISKKQ